MAPCFSYRRSKAKEEQHSTLPVFLSLLCCWTPRHCRRLFLAINKYRRTVSSSGGSSGLQFPARVGLVYLPLQKLRGTLSPRVAPCLISCLTSLDAYEIVHRRYAREVLLYGPLQFNEFTFSRNPLQLCGDRLCLTRAGRV